jgi:hypothetical protein
VESPSEFHKRLQAEITRRRKEVEVRSRGNRVPDNIPKLGLIRILDWIQNELHQFSGYSTSGRNGKPKKLPPEALEYFRNQGAKGGRIGGRIGGKRSLETMTPEERSERARKAVAAREARRKESK